MRTEGGKGMRGTGTVLSVRYVATVPTKVATEAGIASTHTRFYHPEIRRCTPAPSPLTMPVTFDLTLVLKRICTAAMDLFSTARGSFMRSTYKRAFVPCLEGFGSSRM